MHAKIDGNYHRSFIGNIENTESIGIFHIHVHCIYDFVNLTPKSIYEQITWLGSYNFDCTCPVYQLVEPPYLWESDPKIWTTNEIWKLLPYGSCISSLDKFCKELSEVMMKMWNIYDKQQKGKEWIVINRSSSVNFYDELLTTAMLVHNLKWDHEFSYKQ